MGRALLDYAIGVARLASRTNRVPEIRLTVADGHLVGYFPTSGTFNLYLQPDGTFYQEDSHRILVPVRNDDGTFAGLVDQRFLERERGS